MVRVHFFCVLTEGAGGGFQREVFLSQSGRLLRGTCQNVRFGSLM